MSEIQYQLVVRKGPTVGEIIPLDLPIITLGRDPVADAVINDPEISRQHTRFTRSPNGFTVQDLGSTNGTFVNGERIGGEPVELQPNQTISMGSGVTLVYEVILPDTADLEEVDEYEVETAVDQDPSDAFFYTPADDAPPPTYQEPAYEEAEPIAYNDNYGAEPSIENQPNNQRRNIIIVFSLFLVLCCCCSFLTFMWFYGGDWMLQQMGLIP